MSSFAVKCAAVMGATGVALGAYGAHGLKKVVPEPERIEAWGMASRYQLVHAAALLAFSATGRTARYAPALWTAGVSMFSGSIYCLVLNKERFKLLGPVTPLGGLLMIAGWLALLAP
ncbi:hypothetical protein IWW55_007265 [Coemansia sp. RSA 2706]|nr:hypothetical protein LPJ63_000776 [Coemansia sp. RSA 2711]KAJ1849923.1 hypothetical protein LPJ70_000156 [Coemansia sp. RSA 2708]KAJ2285417.1 hypothetical protein IWW55_007265 [Coemansia sp. RSA 2706]KAJ2302742.1 hypothetical protein IWW52_006929 [Coemansia sp. RSA 2704]KAJ2305258.1 hypothetical protein IWW54_005132 [Coemansia sp. RSA 2705]KAJ2310462.1 hypothetical protein IWW51_006616 [Coemansia sp. RSA 2702]KAJ2359517.1 hypothetical protein H4S01_006139 [Coemansia sp. RSA 2610]KAJ236581